MLIWYSCKRKAVKRKSCKKRQLPQSRRQESTGWGWMETICRCQKWTGKPSQCSGQRAVLVKALVPQSRPPILICCCCSCVFASPHNNFPTIALKKESGFLPLAFLKCTSNMFKNICFILELQLFLVTISCRLFFPQQKSATLKTIFYVFKIFSPHAKNQTLTGRMG